MKSLLLCILATAAAMLYSCGVNELPSKNAFRDIVFSFHGNWQLIFTNEGDALQGSIISVDTVHRKARFNSISNNSYCIEDSVNLWQDLRPKSTGTYTLAVLATACSDTLKYQPATLEVIDTDEIRLTGRTATGQDLLQRWRRVRNRGLSE